MLPCPTRPPNWNRSSVPHPETKRLPRKPDAIAPDGSEVRLLLAVESRGSTAHFKLKPGQISQAVTHKTVDEIWYVLKGRGTIWRSMDGQDYSVDLRPGLCITLPLGTAFQFRAGRGSALEILGVTMPPWPNTANEARVVDGRWKPNVR